MGNRCPRKPRSNKGKSTRRVERGEKGHEASVRVMRPRCVRPRTEEDCRRVIGNLTHRKDEMEVTTAVPRTNCPIFLRCKRLCASNCVDSRSGNIFIALSNVDMRMCESEKRKLYCACLCTLCASHIFRNSLCITRTCECSIENFVYNGEIVDRCILL